MCGTTSHSTEEQVAVCLTTRKAGPRVMVFRCVVFFPSPEKIARIIADCSINASYPGWRETLWDAQRALEIKYSVWVAQFEVHYKKKQFELQMRWHICMLIRPVSSLDCGFSVDGSECACNSVETLFLHKLSALSDWSFSTNKHEMQDQKAILKLKLLIDKSLDFRI